MFSYIILLLLIAFQYNRANELKKYEFLMLAMYNYIILCTAI